MAQINWKFVRSEVRDAISLALLGTALTLVASAGRSYSRESIASAALVTSVMWIALWKGNSWLTAILDHWISWLNEPVKRFIIGLAVTIMYTVLVVYLLAILADRYDGELNTTYIISVVVTLIISLFLHGRSFLLNWKKMALEAEKYQRESIAARYEALRNQVNPHFLFNSLNALTNLVYEDKEKASQFIRQLAEVYRYVLASRDKEVVTLASELRFLDSYLFLQQIRFGNKLNVIIHLPEEELFIVPLGLQMLIENAIKHNVVSADDPLQINISYEPGYVVVRNNLQLRSTVGSASTGVGLENISRRYESLGAGPVLVGDDPGFFTVRIPVLREHPEIMKSN